MGGSQGKNQGQENGSEPNNSLTSLPALTALMKGRKGFPLLAKEGASEFNLADVANNLTNRFQILNSLSFISFVSVPQNDPCRRPWTRVSRKRFHPSTLQNEYGQCKTIWPVAQTEALFLPEFPVGLEEKIKLVFLGEISRGAFGQVFHVRCASTSKEFAMKVLSKSQVCSLDAVNQVKQEVMIQHACSHHPFITPLTHFWQTRKLLIVMTEYIGYGELQQLWRSLGRLPECLLTIYVAEIAVALDFLHNAGIIYRDLKMENILLDMDGHIKLIDFGLSKWLPYGGRTRTICGTLQFMAPEILKGEDYGHTSDWWSLGIIAYSLLAGHYPISGYDDHISMSNAVDSFTYSPPQSSSKAMKSLLAGLLHEVPSSRIHNLHQIEREELFKSLDFEDIREKKVSPRRTLERYIEGKSKHNFDEFAGLTSTPKKSVATSPTEESSDNLNPSYAADCSQNLATESDTNGIPARNVSWKDLRDERESKLVENKDIKENDPCINSSISKVTGALTVNPRDLSNSNNFGSKGFNRRRDCDGKTLSMLHSRTPMRHYTTRSTSSPLLSSPLKHPGRLGHHDALVKSVSVCGYNGAAVPLLQSPLLRLARGQKAPVNKGQKAVSASTLPTAVSPLLVNVRGKGRVWEGGREIERREGRWTQDFSDDILSGMNGVYQKSLSDECVQSCSSANKGNKRRLLQRSKTGLNTRHLVKSQMGIRLPKVKDDINEISSCKSSKHALRTELKQSTFDSDEDTLPPLSDNFLENSKEEFFSNLATSTPKRQPQISNATPQTYNVPSSKHSNLLMNGSAFRGIGTSTGIVPLNETDFDESFNKFPWISESLDT